MASSLAFSPAVKPTIQLSLVTTQPVKFDAVFLDRRMREHRMWQNRVAEETMVELFREIEDAIECRTGRGPQKITRAK
jgi:hypothetical protein